MAAKALHKARYYVARATPRACSDFTSLFELMVVDSRTSPVTPIDPLVHAFPSPGSLLSPGPNPDLDPTSLPPGCSVSAGLFVHLILRNLRTKDDPAKTVSQLAPHPLHPDQRLALVHLPLLRLHLLPQPALRLLLLPPADPLPDLVQLVRPMLLRLLEQLVPAAAHDG